MNGKNTELEDGVREEATGNVFFTVAGRVRMTERKLPMAKEESPFEIRHHPCICFGQL